MSNKVDSEIVVSCECAPNIALIKYWGKSNEELILPLNGSISITLDSAVLSSRTCLALHKTEPFNDQSTTIEITLDGKRQTFKSSDVTSASKTDLINKKRFMIMLNKVRSNCFLKDAQLYNFIRIVSTNSFPTASGMASSASGFASLAHCLARAFGYRGDTSELARMGSGSACRSCFGGFVLWSAATQSQSSIATQLFPSSHWSQLNVLALILEDKKKEVPSTNGMRESVLTSELLNYRVKLVQEERLNQMQRFLEEKDFDSMAKLTMKDSNCFHAICMDTQPPLFYLNDKSKKIISLVNRFNSKFGAAKSLVAYSFDAGPNAFLFLQDSSLIDLLYVIFKLFFSHSIDEKKFVEQFIKKSPEFHIDISNSTSFSIGKSQLDEFCREVTQESAIVDDVKIKELIHSKVGQEPFVYESDKFSLLN